jgi:hypothetical protein
LIAVAITAALILVADLAALIADGRGDVPLVRIRWLCGNCRTRLTDFVVSGSHLRPQP